MLPHSLLAHIAWLKMFACVISSMHEVSVSFDLLLHHLHLPPLIPHQPQTVLATLLLPRGQVVTQCVLRFKEMVSTDESFSNTLSARMPKASWQTGNLRCERRKIWGIIQRTTYIIRRVTWMSLNCERNKARIHQFGKKLSRGILLVMLYSREGSLTLKN